MNKLKISIAKHAGFCVGVKRAINLALKTAAERNNVFMLGDIVHNETVCDRINKSGIKKLSSLTSGEGKTLIIRAHGAPQKVYLDAQKKGYDIIDATCPMVKEIHNISINAEKEGYSVIIIGTKKHDEVKGIAGQLKKKPIVIESSEDLDIKTLKRIKKGCVIVQSTQNIEKVLKIMDKLKKIIPDLKLKNTICTPTTMRQDEAKSMPLKNDCVLVIGSKTSANTQRLFEISKKINRHTYWIQTAKNIKKSWFKKAKKVGVLAGASTPEETIKEVVSCLSKI